MKVKIVHNSQKLFNVNVTEKTTIRELKQAISRRIGMEPEDQVLAIKGVFMDDSHALEFYGLPKSDTVVPIDLFLRADSKKKTPIRISLASGTIVNLSIHLDAKVSELRSAIEQDFNVSMKKSEGVRLIFEHYILNDNEILSRYGIKKNSCVLVVKRLAKPSNTFNGSALNQSDDTLSSQTLSTSPKMEEQPPVMNMTNENIKLTVMQPNTPGYVLSFSKSTTLREASEQIEQKTGISTRDQSFALREDAPSPADLSKTLEELGLSDGDNLYIVGPQPPVSGNGQNLNGASNVPPPPPRPTISKMVLIFRDAQNEFNIPLPCDATVQDAMDALRASINGNPGPLWLKNTEDGTYMQDYGSHLNELGVKDGTVIEYLYLPAKSDWGMN